MKNHSVLGLRGVVFFDGVAEVLLQSVFASVLDRPSLVAPERCAGPFELLADWFLVVIFDAAPFEGYVWEWLVVV